MTSFVLGAAPTRLIIPKFDKLICIAAAIADAPRVPDVTIIETHVLWQQGRCDKIRGHKTKKLIVVNGGYREVPPNRFEDIIEWEEREEILSYYRDSVVEQIMGRWMGCTCGVYAICRELLEGNNVISNRISFTRRVDHKALKILKEKYKWRS